MGLGDAAQRHDAQRTNLQGPSAERGLFFVIALEMLESGAALRDATWQLLLLAFGATGHHTAARWWIDWRKTESIHGEDLRCPATCTATCS